MLPSVIHPLTYFFRIRHDTVWITHHADVTHPSICKYSWVIAQAIAFILRVHLRGAPTPEIYHFSAPDDITCATQNLIEAYTQVNSSPVSDAGHDDVDDQNVPADDQSASFHDDEFYVDPLWQPEPTATPKELKTPLRCPTIQPKLRLLIHSLYCQLPPQGSSSNTFHSFLIRYLILLSILPNSDWKNSSGITQAIAALTFGGCLTMYDKMVDGLKEHSDTSLHE